MAPLRSSLLLANAFMWSSATDEASGLGCQKFSKIYTSGKQVCENMWDGAFEYSTDPNAYTMWFFGENPNDKISENLGLQSENVCNLDYFHKEAPGPEGPGFTECHPWKENSCCHDETVNTPEKLRDGYGPEYRWDRCGKLSAACERFFVQEACFYECDANVGLFRKFPDQSHYDDSTEMLAHPHTDDSASAWHNESDPSHNTWQVHKMPIRADYCDAWYTACADDLFCGVADGSYFSCAMVPPALKGEPVNNTGAPAKAARCLPGSPAAEDTKEDAVSGASTVFQGSSLLLLLGWTGMASLRGYSPVL